MNSVFTSSKAKLILNFILIFGCFLFQPASALTQISTSDQKINQLYDELKQHPKQHLPARIDFFSSHLLGLPYKLGALGEGDAGYFDQYPLYRMDAFDCETFVDTVLGLALANNLTNFKYIISQIRYHKGNVSFISRNHFASLDWNPHNQEQGFVKDITKTLKDQNHKSPAQIAKALINKRSWYQHFTPAKIRTKLPCSKLEQEKRLRLLKKKGHKLGCKTAKIAYIPLTALFDANDNPNNMLFIQIPHASIIEIIRPNWDLTSQIGTHLNVSHMGFAIWKNHRLYFREASSLEGKVIDTPFIEYARSLKNSPTIKGINIQIPRVGRKFKD